jgi:hypothetical protein
MESVTLIFFIERELKQRWSTISPISTKRTLPLASNHWIQIKTMTNAYMEINDLISDWHNNVAG